MARHYTSITRQLMSGVRLLDIRLKVIKAPSGSDVPYTFMTCHDTMQQYQSFQSALQECADFLRVYSKEFIAMSLKIDDWNGIPQGQQLVYDALQAALVPKDATWKRELFYVGSYAMPMLAQVRGRIYLLNRVNADMELGVPLSWPGNTEFSKALAIDNALPWSFKAFVQDKWELWGLPDSATSEKLLVFWDAPAKTATGDLLLNYASAVVDFALVVDIKPGVLDKLGGSVASSRPTRLGWSLFDFENTPYPTDTYGMMTVVQIIVASNSGYDPYSGTFQVTGDGKDEP